MTLSGRKDAGREDPAREETSVTHARCAKIGDFGVFDGSHCREIDEKLPLRQRRSFGAAQEHHRDGIELPFWHRRPAAQPGAAGPGSAVNAIARERMRQGEATAAGACLSGRRGLQMLF